MRIDQATGLASGIARPALPRTRRAGAGFSVPADGTLEDGATETSDVESPAPPTQVARPLSLDALSGALSGGPAAQSDQVAAGQGRALLGALAGLQLATLGGGGVQARRTLADLARALPGSADPGLDAVLQAIAQRAAIELARSE